MPDKFRYKMVVEYIGTNYSGSQAQPNGNTIQQKLEDAVCTLIKTKTRIIPSGRTDSGVHAKGQVVHFDSQMKISSERFVNSMNGLLPDDISIKSVEAVSDRFHAQKSAKWKWYRYTIVNRPQRSAFDGHSLLIRYKLDIERLNEVLSYLVGEHDFTTFKSVQTNNPAKVCKVYYAKAQKQGDFVYLDFVADRFLYNMIRNIVGTLLKIERNSLSPSIIKEILESKDRQQSGEKVSPDGLTLMKVNYTNEINMENENENLFGKTS